MVELYTYGQHKHVDGQYMYEYAQYIQDKRRNMKTHDQFHCNRYKWLQMITSISWISSNDWCNKTAHEFPFLTNVSDVLS